MKKKYLIVEGKRIMEKESRIHRVGTITVGLTLIAFGVLFILHTFVGIISYETIFKLWPLVFIGLGIEVLLSNISEKKFVYDKVAVFILIMMFFFAICMAGADMMFTYLGTELKIQI